MDRQKRAVLYLTAWLLVTSCGCASWSKKVFHTATNRAPDFESTLSLARLSERHGEPSQAAEVYRAVLAKDPQNKTAHHRLAVLAIKQQQFDLAENHFQQALAGTPDSQLLSDWGYFLYLVDRLPEAEAALRQSLQLDQGNATAHNNLGLVLGTTNRLEESLAEFRFAGNESTARANLGYVHSLNGDFEKSEAEYHQALQLDSQLKPAAEALLALHARNDARTAAALAYNPTIPAHNHEPSQVSTVSFSDQDGGQPLSTSATGGAVEKIGVTMETNSSANVIPAGYSEPLGKQTSTIQQAMQVAPAAPIDSAPMSLQSLPPQPWQMPTWTAQQVR